MSVKYKKIESDNEINKLLNDTFDQRFGGWIEAGEAKVVLTHRNTELLDRIRNIENIKDNDIIVVGHPRSGTNWLQEIVWLIGHDCDFESAKKPMLERCHYLEGAGQIETNTYELFVANYPPLDYLKQLTITNECPRLIKTHYPWEFLPKVITEFKVRPKLVYIYRNPKDVCVSFYHLTSTLCEYHGTFEEFCKLFLAGRTYYGPYWHNIKSFWNIRNEPNILFLKFSDVKNNMTKILHQVADFFGKKLTEEEVQKLLDHLSFDSMKNNDYVNYHEVKHYKSLHTTDKNYNVFIRKGQVGNHTEEMSPEIIKEFDKWIEENNKDMELSF